MAKAVLYNWNDLPREAVREGVERCGFRGEDVLLVMNWLEPGMDINPHSHPFEQVVCIVQGHVRFHVGDDALARLEAVQPLVGASVFVDLGIRREDVDLRQAVSEARLEIVRVVRGRDLHGARAELGVHERIRDDGDFPVQ